MKRYSYIHSRVRELGFPDLGTYLVVRRVVQRATQEFMAGECHVRINTIRKFMKEYGIESRRSVPVAPRMRRGDMFTCACGAKRYYPPAQAVKLNQNTYRCRTCKKGRPHARSA